MLKTNRLIELAQSLVDEWPDFFEKKGAGAGDRDTNAYMKELKWAVASARSLIRKKNSLAGLTRPTTLVVVSIVPSSNRSSTSGVLLDLRHESTRFGWLVALLVIWHSIRLVSERYCLHRCDYGRLIARRGVR